METLTEADLHTRWRDRWQNFLELVETAESPEEARNVLRDKVIIGNAERKIAGGHEGREILELLQNARDAIWNGEADRGRVHIGVYDEGVLIANTGSRFDLFDPQVEDAVTMIGETGKGDDDDQSIGHKGVGLKSILATGDAFEIFTRPDEATDNILGVRLSRTYLVAALLNRLGHESEVVNLADDLEDSDLAAILSRKSRDDELPITDELSESISKLPLFNFPVPLSTDSGSSDPVRDRVQQLLTEPPGDPDGERFRTAVFIRYEDTDWRSQLAEFGIPVPDEDEGQIEDRPQRIWQYLSASENEGGLQPETLVQLGGIEELHLERAPSAGDGSTIQEQWRISRTPGEPTIDELAHDEVQVRITSDGRLDSVHRFDHFGFADPRDHHTAILVNKGRDGEPTPIQSYPLYLFYPIEGTDAITLPFCLHGRFRVETNRKSLSSNNAATNKRVLQEGLDLVELIGREVAAAADKSGYSRYSDHLPWVLLPPIPEAGGFSDPSSDELIDWFRQRLLVRLSNTECVPTNEGPKQPEETLLHWDHAVIKAYLSFRIILDEINRDPKQADRPLPTQQALEATLALPTTWSDRVKALLQADDEQSVSRAILTDWVAHLDASLSMQKEDSPMISVPADASRSLLEGTVSLLTGATDENNTLDEILESLSEQFDGVYLLPCRIRDVDPDERLALVTLEQRRSPSGGQMSQQRVRSVIWDIESSSRDIERPPTPPQSSNMTVYFLDEGVQEVADVHHVLSTAGRVWGLRAYEGMPSFVRSLLDTFADGRHDVVEPIDFAFLAAIVDRLGAESTDLQTNEGDFFPLEYLRTAVTQQEGDQRGNLRRRVQLRTCNLNLHGDTTRSISDTVLGDGWQQIRGQERTTNDEDDITEEWRALNANEYPTQIWPEPDTDTWHVFRKQINRDVTDLDFARTLALLGAGTLPGIRTLWMYGEDHPSMRQTHHWNPTEWTSEDFSNGIPDGVTDVQSALEEAPDYPDLITSSDHHPQQSADHSRKCPAKVSGELNQVNLASWIWIDSVEELNEYGAAVREILRRHGDALNATLLRTGWSCNNGHKRRAWTDSVPSLLNWQLRELDIWDPVVEINDELATEWGTQASRLRYAVRLKSRRGAQAARMFPYIQEESGFSDELLDTFGVRPVHELTVTGATERLQKLQSVLVDGALPDDGTAQLWIPGERINDWNQAYTQLLQPVLNQLPENIEDEEDELTWGGLTHLPLRDGDQWVTASVDWIEENADQIRYYQDQSPKPWETQAVEDEGYYILPRTASGPFTRLSTALGVKQLQASKLIFDLETDDVNIITEQYSDSVSDFKRVLAERRDILVASTERTDEQEIVATADKLTTAYSNIAVADSFPDDALRQLSDPTSALYATDEGQEALLLNAAETNGELSLDDLAMGLALLVERPTKVATFREALREDISIRELETRWAKRTFPIEIVKRILGSNALQSVDRDTSALNNLLQRLGKPVVDTEPLLTALEDANTETITGVREWLATGEQPERVLNDGEVDIQPVKATVTEIRTELPESLSFIASGLFGDAVTHWVREFEQCSLDHDTERIIIDWLDEHRDVLARPPFDNTARQAYTRLQTVMQLWEQTDTSELSDIETWVDRLHELHSDTHLQWTATLPEEHRGVLDCPPFVVHVCINNRVGELVSVFCETIESEMANADFDWRAVIGSYIGESEIPEIRTETGAKDHQERAFAELATTIQTGDSTTGLDFSNGTTFEPPTTEAASATLSVSTGGGSGGGNSQFRGRGQQAEAYVMAGVLDRVAKWLDEYSGSDFFQFRSRLRRLHAEQQDVDYKWHVEGVWSSELLPILENSKQLDQTTVTDWRSKVATGFQFTELPLIKLINVTMERGPGFDVIDPRGPLSTDAGQNNVGLWFTPVEIKAVDGTSPPFNFRLTTNEYRQAKAFIRDGNIPYVIRLVKVPEPGTKNWAIETTVVAEKVIETESELNEIIGSQQFEDIVKGGYMNMRIQ